MIRILLTLKVISGLAVLFCMGMRLYCAWDDRRH